MSKWSEKVRLNEEVCAKATYGQIKGKKVQRFYIDTRKEGLRLIVYPSGRKVFVQMVGQAGRKYMKPVGDFRTDSTPDGLTFKQAVEKADDLRSQFKDTPKEGDGGITLGQAWELLKGDLERKVEKGEASQRTIDGYAGDLRRYLSGWLKRPLKGLGDTDGRAEVRARHTEIAHEVARGDYALKTAKGKPRKRKDRTGKSTADSAFRTFSAIWNRAMQADAELPVCPVINIKGAWYRPKSKRGKADEDGALPAGTLFNADTLKTWYESIGKIDHTVRRDCLRLMLFTGLRSESARAIAIKHVDLDKRLLRVRTTKGNRPFTLPLSDYLVDLLRERIADNLEHDPKCKWLFPSIDREGNPCHLVELREDIAGIDWQPHDLRKVFTTQSARLNVSQYKIKLLDNHKLPEDDVTAEHYIKFGVEDLRGPMQQITDALLAIVAPKPEQKVVEITKASKRRKAA